MAVNSLASFSDYIDRNMAKVQALIWQLCNASFIDGPEVLQRIKSDPATKHSPVVVMTSSSEDRDIVEGCQRGVNSCQQNRATLNCLRTP